MYIYINFIRHDSLNFRWDSKETNFEESCSISRNFRLVKESEVFKTIKDHHFITHFLMYILKKFKIDGPCLIYIIIYFMCQHMTYIIHNIYVTCCVFQYVVSNNIRLIPRWVTGYEWAKRTKFILSVIYSSSRRHSYSYKIFKKMG